MGRKRSNLAENCLDATMPELVYQWVLSSYACVPHTIASVTKSWSSCLAGWVSAFRPKKVFHPSVCCCGAGALFHCTILESAWHSMLARYAISNDQLLCAVGSSRKLPVLSALIRRLLGLTIRAASAAATVGWILSRPTASSILTPAPYALLSVPIRDDSGLHLS